MYNTLNVERGSAQKSVRYRPYLQKEEIDVYIASEEKHAEVITVTNVICPMFNLRLFVVSETVLKNKHSAKDDMINIVTMQGQTL